MAGYAACFASTLRTLAGERSIKGGAIGVDGEATLSVRDDGTYLVSHVKLVVRADWFGGSGPSLVEDAKRFCPYSNAARGNVVTEIILD